MLFICRNLFEIYFKQYRAIINSGIKNQFDRSRTFREQFQANDSIEEVSIITAEIQMLYT
jgi:hypothetical protein